MRCKCLLFALLVAGVCGSGFAQQVAPSFIAGVSAAGSDSGWSTSTAASGPDSGISRDVAPADAVVIAAPDGPSVRLPRHSHPGDVNPYPSLGIEYGHTIGNLRIYAFAQDREADIGGLVYYLPEGRLGPVRFDYMIQVLPLWALHQPRYYNNDSVGLTSERRTTFGGAIYPVGTRLILNPKSKLQVSLYGSGGFAYFTRRILSEGATRLNIGLEFGMNFEHPVTENSSVAIGYAISHLSNSNIHLKNPALDMNTIQVQYLFQLHGHRRFW